MRGRWASERCGWRRFCGRSGDGVGVRVGEPYRDREPDTYPRWALVVRPYNRIELVLLCRVESEVARGAYVIAREDPEMFVPIVERWDRDLQSGGTRRVWPPPPDPTDDNGANEDDGD